MCHLGLTKFDVTLILGPRSNLKLQMDHIGGKYLEFYLVKTGFYSLLMLSTIYLILQFKHLNSNYTYLPSDDKTVSQCV